MAKKKKKLSTPDWILEGFDSEEAYDKKKGVKKEAPKSVPRETSQKVSTGGKKSGKIFKLRRCPKCKSDDVGIVLSGSDSEDGGGKEWECRKCKWKGANINEQELTEDEFMKYLDEKGEEVS